MKITTLFCLCVAALLFLGASKLGPPAPNWPPGWPTNFTTNGMSRIPLETVTNDFHWETPTPGKVTIWFQYQWNNGFEFSPASLGSITTNVWPVTASNATSMAKAFLNSNGSDWKFITLTGIWRDE